MNFQFHLDFARANQERSKANYYQSRPINDKQLSAVSPVFIMHFIFGSIYYMGGNMISSLINKVSSSFAQFSIVVKGFLPMSFHCFTRNLNRMMNVPQQVPG